MGSVSPESAWPEWKLIQPIGEGSYGTVYEVERRDGSGVESHAAVKVVSIPHDESELDILRMGGMDEAAIQREMDDRAASYAGEIQILYDLQGASNIVMIQDFKRIPKKDSPGWIFFIRMEMLTPLSKYLGDRSLGEKAVIKLGTDICTALEICESNGLIHRDIKPANIFVSKYGGFKLGDFGVALQMDGTRFEMTRQGTTAYMAPEVEKGLPYDMSADLYSLGIVLYKLMNGQRLPFVDSVTADCSAKREAIRRRLDGEVLPPPSQASPQMSDVILRACAYDSYQRFSSATEMKAALEEIANGKSAFSPGSVAPPHSPARAVKEDTIPQEAASQEPARTGKSGKRRRRVLIPLLFVALAVVAFAVLSGMQNNRADRYGELVRQQVQAYENEDAEEEKEAFEEAVLLQPAELDSYYQHAFALHGLRTETGIPDYQACIDFVEEAILANEELDLTQSRMADVYYLYADSLFQTAQNAESEQRKEALYTESVEAYEKLLSISTGGTQYDQDYAIALAYAGNLDKAAEILDEAEKEGYGSANLSYNRGEVAQMRGEYDEALEYFEECIASTSDEDLAAHAYLSCSDTYQTLGDLEAAREVLMEAKNKNLDSAKTPQILQDLGKVDRELANRAETAARTATEEEAEQFLKNASEYRQEAIETLNSVIIRGWGTSTTSYSLVVLYQQDGQLESAEKELLSMEEAFGEDYQWYKRYAFLEVSKQEVKNEEDRDYRQFVEYYDKAEDLYEIYLQNGGTTEDEMTLLDEQYEKVKSMGRLPE